MFHLNRTARLVLGGIVLWYAATLGFWAVRPLSDTVPVGVDNTLKTPASVSVHVSCHTLFRSAPRSNSPLPTLTAQPVGQPPLAYSHTPCVRTHSEARRLFAFDTLCAIGAIALVLWLVRRGGDQAPARRLDPVSA